VKLERAVAVRHVVGTSAERRRHARVAAQVALWRMFAAALSIPIAMLAWSASSAGTITDETRALVRTYSFEAFPQWAQIHHEEACPKTIEDLSPIVARDRAIDPWGTPLELRCGSGIRFAYVRSAGPDRRFDTTDDISSND
jgi:hypothetical protein